MEVDKYEHSVFLLFPVQLWENKRSTKRRMEDHLFGVQDTRDLETSGAGTPSACLISPNSTLEM